MKRDRARHQPRVSRPQRDHRQWRPRTSTASPPRDIPFSPDPDSPVAVPGTCRITTHNDAEKTWAKVTYMARLEYDLGEDLLAYALTNTGFKSGVIQDGGTHADPEEVVNYELGLKATLLRRLHGREHRGLLSPTTPTSCARASSSTPTAYTSWSRATPRAPHIYGLETEWLWKPGASGHAAGRVHLAERRVPRLSDRRHAVLRRRRSARRR